MRLVAIFGSTGTGKSQLAISLAQACIARGQRAEIINFDVMQMYKGMPIVTNKPTPRDLEAVPHHFVGHLLNDPDDAIRIDAFQTEFHSLVQQLNDKDILPIAAGGSHHYLQHAILPNNLASQLPPKDDYDEDLKAAFQTLNPPLKELVASLDKIGPVSSAASFPDSFDTSALPAQFSTPDTYAKGLYDILKHLDPESAARWHWAHVRRVRRSVDILVFEKRTLKNVQDEQRNLSKDSHFDTLAFWVYCDKDELHARLEKRLASMINNGFVDELWAHYTTYFSSMPLDEGLNQAIGVKEFLPLFQERPHDLHDRLHNYKTNPSLDDPYTSAVNRANKTYAKKQRRWITHQLIPACAHASNVNLYLLDGSNLDTWGSSVNETAKDITFRMYQNSH